MTDTDTITRTLVAVKVSESWDDRPPAGIGNGEFFAVKDGEMHHTLIVPESDPRSRGMWGGVTYARQAGLDNPGQYRAWTISDQYVTVLAPAETPREVSRASQLRKGDAFTIGTRVTAYDTQYVVTGDSPDDGQSLPIAWNTGALDNWSGPSSDIAVRLVPESDQTERTRAKVREVSPVETPEVETPEDSTPEESVTLTASELARQLAEAKASGKSEAEATFESWKASANRTAIAYANDNSLCSEFDRCMRDIGMLDRDQHREEFPDEYEREFEVTVTYTTTVMATDVESAVESVQENVDSYTIRSYGDWEAEESY